MMSSDGNAGNTTPAFECGSDSRRMTKVNVRLAAVITVIAAVLVLSPLLATDLAVQEEYEDAKSYADRIRQMDAGPLRSVFLSRFEIIEREYLRRARSYEEIAVKARDAIARHDRSEKEFLGKLESIKSRAAQAAPGSSPASEGLRAELEGAVADYRAYLSEWEVRRKEMLAAHAAATTELEKSRAPLVEFQRVYRALADRRIAFTTGMRWHQLVDARLLAFARPCDAAKSPNADEAPEPPFLTVYRGAGAEQWERRKDLGAPDTEVPDSAIPATLVCVREVNEVVGHYRGSGAALGPAAVSVQWHVALVRVADESVLATKVLYGTPPPDTATVFGTPISAPSIRGKPPEASDLVEWVGRRSSPPR